jgi:hypothetical protein
MKQGLIFSLFFSMLCFFSFFTVTPLAAAFNIESLYLNAVELEDRAVTKEDYTKAAQAYELIISSFPLTENQELTASVLYSLSLIYLEKLNKPDKAAKLLNILISRLGKTSWAGRAKGLIKNPALKPGPHSSAGLAGIGVSGISGISAASGTTDVSGLQAKSDTSDSSGISGASDQPGLIKSRVFSDSRGRSITRLTHEEGFKISYFNENWEKIDNVSGSPINDISLILFRMPGENTENLPVTNIVVLYKKLVKPFDPEFMAVQFVDELGLNSPATRVIKKESLEKNGNKCLLFNLTTQVDSQKLSQKWLIAAGKDRGFIVGATIPYSLYYNLVSEIDFIINSFDLSGP